ncbi:AP-5 complex subunit sigma-1 [Narcine bancroftii]|uniref:AP-5 complex subunit sigma-1 n=1 Tax=Narcine bancroftii TaxID=1343680 RepID=UPI0038314F8D
MVRGFVLLALGRGRSRVLYSRLFAAEEPPGGRREEAPAPGSEQPGLGLQRRRLRAKERLVAVARQVSSSCILVRQAADKPLCESGSAIGEESIGFPEPDLGVFRLSAGDVFTEETIVVWMGVLSLGFALICDLNENLMLAENTLRLLVKYFKEHLKLFVQSNDIVLKTDKIEAILNMFLPHGQLMFINCCFLQSLEKELSASMFK